MVYSQYCSGGDQRQKLISAVVHGLNGIARAASAPGGKLTSAVGSSTGNVSQPLKPPSCHRQYTTSPRRPRNHSTTETLRPGTQQGSWRRPFLRPLHDSHVIFYLLQRAENDQILIGLNSVKVALQRGQLRMARWPKSVTLMKPAATPEGIR